MNKSLISINLSGNAEGIDPRTLPRLLLEGSFAEQKFSRAIRAKCVDCCCGQISEVARCTATGCPLWPFRMGTNPFSNRTGNPNAFKRTEP